MKARIGLIMAIAIITVLLISSVLFYWKTLILQNDLNSASATNTSYWNAIQNLTQEKEDLKKPQFFTTQLNWSIVQESETQFRIDVRGTVLNAGVYGATEVVAEPSFRIFGSNHDYMSGITPENFTISSYLWNGVFEGKTFRDFSQSFYTSNLLVWHITAIDMYYQYSTTV